VGVEHPKKKKGLQHLPRAYAASVLLFSSVLTNEYLHPSSFIYGPKNKILFFVDNHKQDHCDFFFSTLTKY